MQILRAARSISRSRLLSALCWEPSAHYRSFRGSGRAPANWWRRQSCESWSLSRRVGWPAVRPCRSRRRDGWQLV